MKGGRKSHMEEMILNKYRVIGALGEGAAGNVYLVENLHLNRREALKLCADTKETMELLSGEAEVLKQLTHPLLPAIYDLFSWNGKLCMVMEYVEGITLEAYLQKYGPAGEEKAIRWAVSLTEVLGYLHDQKPEMIYRDLKPSNIMVLPDGNIRLVDLGAVHVAAYGLHNNELLAGTPGYSPPEQWQKGSVCKESDVYALGMVLHEMLTALQPVSGCQKRRPVREYDRSISHSLERVIENCIREQPQERYHSMGRLQKELLSCSKKQRRKERSFRIRHSLSVCLFMLAFARMTLPFLWGVDSRRLPFPYLKEPLLLFLAALCFYMFAAHPGPKENRSRLEKSVFLTEKKFPGLFVILLVTILLSGGIPVITATEKREELWVDMRDESGRKCLMKEGSAYCLKDKMWFELTKESLPAGISSLQLIALGEDNQVYESRVFFVENN